MMIELLGDRSDLVRERQGVREILEAELALEMVSVHDLPLDAMAKRFLPIDEDHRNVVAESPLELWIEIDIHFASSDPCR